MVSTSLGSPMNLEIKPVFDWQRFWVPRTGSIDLSDGGFLNDPTNLFVRSDVERARPLSELAEYRALVLLGEPGIGKSTTLLEEAARVRAQPVGETSSIHVDLRAYSSETLLHKRVFESIEFLGWEKGNSHLVLHLDSLDEALLRIDNIANLLADELPRHPTDRLSVRIACRTAVCPSAILETALYRIWGEPAVGVFELAPLRRCDVVAAAEVSGIDVESFFRELYSASAVPFAIKPLTLNLLLALFKKDGRLPNSVANIYLRGCLKLCEEQNLSRRGAGRVGMHTAAQRLRVASRIAAATMLANRYAVWTGPEGDGIPDEDVALSLLAGEREQGDFPPFEVTEQSVRETLDTGLFSSRGGDRMGWAHQGYAEFLAAQYLEAKEVASPNILKMLIHPSGGLVPQLNAVTAWAASISKDVRRELIRTEPMVLLQGDLTNWTASDLRDLTESLMIALEESRAFDFSIGISGFYERLNHPGLSSQLRPYILDASKNEISRRTAILIAERCELRVLQPELLTLALDRTADPYLRGRAVDALSTCGDETVPPKLLPLAKGELGPDPQDEIRGYALRILWPRHISADELFSMITRPNEGFVGSYVMFLTKTLPETLTADDLPIALNWASSLVAEPNHTADYNRRSLADSIFVRAWTNLDHPGVLNGLLDYVFARLRPSHELFGGTGLRETKRFDEDLELDVARRRRLLVAAARRPLTGMDAYHLMRARLLQYVDLDWLLSICPGALAYNTKLNPDTLCNMVVTVAAIGDPERLKIVYDAAVNWPALWHSFKGVFEGVSLASEEARQLRRTHEMMKGFEERKQPLVTPPPAQRIAELLNLFEAGDWTAWWRLNRELTLTPTSQFYGSDLDYSISEMPGWQDADASTRQRILSGASRYLVVGETSISERIGATKFYYNDFAAFRAMLLLREFDQPAYRAIAPEIWKKWAPVAAAVPKSTGSEKAKFQTEVVADASAYAPEEFTAAVRDMMRGERARAAEAVAAESQPPGASFFVLRELEGCWDNDALKIGLLAELQDSNNTEDQFACILDALLAAQFAPARTFAIARLTATNPHERRYAMAAAVSLAAHCAVDAWTAIWKLVVHDPTFGQTFFLKIAQQYRFQDSLFSPLSDDQLAEIYVYLERTFPRGTDPKHISGLAHFVGPRESLAHLRDSIPQQIVNRGTAASVSAMQWIVGELPELTWLSFRLLEAQRTMRTKTWSPLSPKELFALMSSKNRLLVQSPDDLLELLVGALRKFEQYLHGEQNPVRALWDRQAGGQIFRPIEEDSFSDMVRLYLRRELVESGVVANREVEVARVPGAPVGRRTDIRIDALRRSADGEAYDTITAVIESKGCWNDALFGALKDQLYRDYMVTLRAPVGIYLVGWFDKLKWDPKDRRKRQTPDLTLHEAQTRLDCEAAAIPQGYLVRALVIDCRVP